MLEMESEVLPNSSETPMEARQSGNSTSATPQSPAGGKVIQPEPEAVPSTSGTSSRVRVFTGSKSRMEKKKRENWEDAIISAFKFIKITGEWNDNDFSDDEEEGGGALKISKMFDYKKSENAILELAEDSEDTYPEVDVVDDQPKPSTSPNAAPGTGTPANEPQPVSGGNIAEEITPASAPTPATALALIPAPPPPPPLPRVSPLDSGVFSSTPFYHFRVTKETIRNLRDALGITLATVLQEKAIPPLMQEKDAFLHAPRGSGKTVAFAIPVVQHLLLIKPNVCREDGIRVLVIVPNRSSVVRTFEIFRFLVQMTPWITIGQFGGSENFKTEKVVIRKGVTVLVSTPQRFVDHLRHTNYVFMRNMSCLVVDGVDEIFQQGGERPLSDLVTVLDKGLDYLHHPDYITTYETEHVEASRQTILISTLITQRVARFVGLNTTKPLLIDDKYDSPPRPFHIPIIYLRGGKKQVKLPPPLVNQYFMIVPEELKLVALVGFIMWKCKVANGRTIMVFTGTQTMADFFSDLFRLAYGKRETEGEGEPGMEPTMTGMEVYKINPFLDIDEKIDLFMKFSKSRFGVLFCSDNAVRGINLPRVDWVVHLNAPTCSAGYMARIGMINPGLQIGSSLMLLLPSERGFVQELKNRDIPLTCMKLKPSFRYLWAFYQPSNTFEDITFNIHSSIEEIVHQSVWMRDRACLAFGSWCRLYSSYPGNLKHLFHLSHVNMDKYVRSFGLREQSAYVINQARKLHADARSKLMEKHAPVNKPGVPSASCIIPHKPDPNNRAVIASLRMDNDSKKRKSNERMGQAGCGTGRPQKMAK